MYIYENRVKGGQNFITIINNEGSEFKIKNDTTQAKDITNDSPLKFQNF